MLADFLTNFSRPIAFQIRVAAAVLELQRGAAADVRAVPGAGDVTARRRAARAARATRRAAAAAAALPRAARGRYAHSHSALRISIHKRNVYRIVMRLRLSMF